MADELGQLLSAPAAKKAKIERKEDIHFYSDDDFIGDEEESDDEGNSKSYFAVATSSSVSLYNNNDDGDGNLTGEEGDDAGGGAAFGFGSSANRKRGKRSRYDEGQLLKNSSNSAEQAVAVNRTFNKRGYGCTLRKLENFYHNTNEADNDTTISLADSSLLTLCRSVVVTNLERYPADVLGLLNEDDWEEIIQLRHSKTCPKAGSGGLDGSGRKKPAVDAKFLSEVEKANPHLAESTLVDELVWKDCINFRFATGGLLNAPRTLLYPWPVLVQTIQEATNRIMKYSNIVAAQQQDPEDEQQQHQQFSQDQIAELEQAIRTLRESPMNISLLKESGAGKSIKKIIKQVTSSTFFNNHLLPVDYSPVGMRVGKKRSILKHLEKLLASWMEMAASKGVKMDDNISKKANNNSNVDTQKEEENKHLLLLEKKCPTWRKLYFFLKRQEDKKRENQGAKMRQIRKNLQHDRPKVVKVRQVVNKSKLQERLLGDPNKCLGKGRGIAGLSSSEKAQGKNLLQIRKEVSIMSKNSRQRPIQPAGAGDSGGGGAGFGAAVAFAQIGTKPKRKAFAKPASVVSVTNNGRFMKTPVKKKSSLLQKLKKR